jgi:hypothetical protein
MKMIGRIILICFVLFCLIYPWIPFEVNTVPVMAAGSTKVKIYPASASYYAEFNHTTATHTTWVYNCTNASIGGGNERIGWWSTTENDIDRSFPYSAILGYSMATVPDDAEIVSMKLVFPIFAKNDNEPNYTDFYWSVFKTNPGPDLTITTDDADNWFIMNQQGYQRLSAPQHYTSLVVSANYTVDLLHLEQAKETYTNDYVWYQIMTEKQFSFNDPGYGGNGLSISFDYTPSGTYLEVEYVAEAQDRGEDLHDNAPVDTEILGTEVADNITLETLNVMYADETLSFLVNGESGANLTLEKYDASGAIIGSTTNTVRTDGIYAWQFLPPNSAYSGFIRIHEVNNDLWSAWVSVQPAPDSSEFTNLCYSRYTKYPQYTNTFDSYVVKEGDIMYIHWKTNINPASELDDYTLQLWSNGNYEAYDIPLDNITVDGTLANRQAKMHWRFMAFTPGKPAGFNDYGGLILDMNLDESSSLRHGFVQPIIIADSDNSVLADCHSAYWYLSAANKGLTTGLISPGYTNNATIEVSLNVGDECKVETNLYTGTMIAYTRSTSFIAKLGQQTVQLLPITADGTYTITMQLSNPGIHTYVYRYDFSVVISDSGSPGGGGGDATDLSDIIDNLLAKWHLNNVLGHYIIIIVLMAICLVAGTISKNRLALVVGCTCALLILGVGIVIKWVDIWLVALLALGAGLSIWQMIRNKAAGGAG